MSSLSSSNLLLLQKRVSPHLRLTLGAVGSLSHFMILLFQIGIPLLDDKLIPKDMKATIIHYNPLYIIRHQPTEVEPSHCGELTMTAPAAVQDVAGRAPHIFSSQDRSNLLRPPVPVGTAGP